MKPGKNQPFSTRLRFAAAGILYALRTERSLQTQACVLVLSLVVLGLLHPAAVWWAIVLAMGSAVLSAELFNSAVERLADHLHPDLHPEIKLVKDCAAGAVLLCSIGSVGVGVALVVAVIRGS